MRSAKWRTFAAVLLLLALMTVAVGRWAAAARRLPHPAPADSVPSKRVP